MVNLQKAAEVIAKTCMNIKKDEKVLIITDSGRVNIGKAIYEEAKKITQTKLLEITVGKQHGEEPSKEVAEEMKKYDVVIIPTTKSLSHTNARREANKTGARIATLPGATEDMIERCIDIDYDKLGIVNTKIKKLLLESKEIRVTTEKGTDIKTSAINTKGDFGLYHKKGDFGNLPTGEVDSGVKEGTTEGTIIVDASFGGIGKIKNKITLEVKKGYVVSICGEEEAEKLNEFLEKIGEQAYKIAEFGIGTNPKALITGNILEDEKVLGTVHFAVGNDMTYGGKNDVPIHLDGIVRKPTIYIDKKKIMDKGKLMI